MNVPFSNGIHSLMIIIEILNIDKHTENIYSQNRILKRSNNGTISIT